MEDDLVAQVMQLMADGRGDRAIAKRLGITRHKARTLMSDAYRHWQQAGEAAAANVRYEYSDNASEISGVVRATERSQSLEALLADAEVDLSVWRVIRWVANMWGRPEDPHWQVKAWLERKSQQQLGLEELIKKLEDASPVVPMKFEPRAQRTGRKALEISIMDPHFGLRSFEGPSGDNYTPEIAKRIYKESIELLLERALPFGPFEQICFVAGNDFMHADNVFHTTTQGTVQPEMDSWHQTFDNAEELLCETIEGLTAIAPVYVPVIPGNHARQSEHALGRIIRAYFRNNDNVVVDAGPEPYKFWQFGQNLIGFEHGHSIKPIRLASLMANECPIAWSETWCREWHCGDQHRESAVFSEFGVSIKYLPSMVTWNEWHKIKGFSHQHRASLGFVYHEHDGLISTPQVNFREVY